MSISAIDLLQLPTEMDLGVLRHRRLADSARVEAAVRSHHVLEHPICLFISQEVTRTGNDATFQHSRLDPLVNKLAADWFPTGRSPTEELLVAKPRFSAVQFANSLATSQEIGMKSIMLWVAGVPISAIVILHLFGYL